MTYTEELPPGDLAPWVRSFWEFTTPTDLAEPYRHRVLPDGCVSLILAKTSYLPPDGRVVESKPTMRAFEMVVRAGDQFNGICLQPGVSRALLGPEPELDRLKEGVDAFIPVLRDWANHAEPPDARVQKAVALLSDGTMRTADVASAVGLSERQLQRRFGEDVGLTPKQYARIRRFRTALNNVLREEPETWGRVAMNAGFADQAHMTREFTDFFGASPEALRAHVSVITHVDVRP